MFRAQITIATLMRLVAADPATAAGHISKVYEWRYSEATTVAKALVGAGFALGLPLLLPVIQPDAAAPLSIGGVIVVMVSATVFILIGAIVFIAAHRIHLEFVAAQTLVGQLADIRPFLQRYEGSRP